MTATLNAIQMKVRRITKRPSQNQLTTAELNQYINTFYLYDFPEQIKIKDMLTNYSFTTEPNQEAYPLPIDPQSTTSTTDPAAPSYTSIEPPIYIAGYQSFFTQSQENFYRLYPPIAINSQTESADGTVGPFTFTLSNYPVMQNRVVISCLNTASQNFVLTDQPVNNVTGNLIGDGTGTINYLTGSVSVTFSNFTEAGAPINCQIVPYQPSRPTAMLFYQNNMILRPIPDSSYQVKVSAYQTFTNFIMSNDTPYIKQWWQYIALGTAMKIFEDLGDFEAIAQYKPLLDEQRFLSQRRTIVEQANERASTIYSEQTQITFSNFFGAI